MYGAPISSAVGSHAQTYVNSSIARLKEKSPQSITKNELIEYLLPMQSRYEDLIARIAQFLKVNTKVQYNAKEDSFKYRPTLQIFSSEDLLKYLQNQDTARGVHMRDLTDGWPDAKDAIDKLDAEHKILVSRNKKDNSAKQIWANDPTLHAPIDDEFKEMWDKFPIPDGDNLVKDLRKMGVNPTGNIVHNVVTKKEVKKPKGPRRGAKVTNTHMKHVFQDYSSKRQAAAK